MEETKDLAQLRQLNLELLRQLWVGQDAVQRSVAKAVAESSQDSSSSYNAEVPLSQEKFSMAPRASCPRDASRRDPCDTSSSGGASSGVTSLPPPKCQHQEALSPLRPCSAPLGATSDSNGPECSAELEAQALRSILDQQSKLPKPRVTFNKESPVPEKSWRLRPYLGYDWIAGTLDNSSPISSESEDFFLRLREFREANKAECIHRDPDVELLGLWESAVAEEEHECVYCYRVNRRLFLVPWDPGTPCRLCRTPRDQQDPEVLADPAQVSTVCWDGTFSLRSPREAQPSRAWTSGPALPPRPSARSYRRTLATRPQHSPLAAPFHPSRTLTLRPRRGRGWD
ncbi:migration and invasion-inhibitory protein isoform 3-T4 [Glossophaga mutica]